MLNRVARNGGVAHLPGGVYRINRTIRVDGLGPIRIEGEGYGEGGGPESQGEYAGEGFGNDAQGTFGDEDYDPTYEGEREGRRDGALEDEVRERLLEAFEIDPVDLTVVVRDGTAILDGLVDDLAVRDAMEQAALDVPRVRAVENRLRQRRGTEE